MAIKARHDHQILWSAPKAADLEAHLRLVTIEDVQFLEIRDFIVSTGEYGRGYWLPFGALDLMGLAAELTAISKELQRQPREQHE